MHEQLKAKLSQLHTTLAELDQLDDDSKGMLKQLDTDIQRLLDDGQADAGLNTRQFVMACDQYTIRMGITHVIKHLDH